MADVFELYMMNVTRAYKLIQQIKKHETVIFGLKGYHVTCLYYLGKYPDGLTVTELSEKCVEDKAAISRTLDSLAEMGYVAYQQSNSKRRWRNRITLTDEGKKLVGEVNHVIDGIVGPITEGYTVREEVQFYQMFAGINEKLTEYYQSIERTEKNT